MRELPLPPACRGLAVLCLRSFYEGLAPTPSLAWHALVETPPTCPATPTCGHLQHPTPTHQRAHMYMCMQCDDLDEDLLEDDDDALPVWEHEHRVKALPFTGKCVCVWALEPSTALSCIDEGSSWVCWALIDCVYL